jgi:hypothetical protein
MENHYLDNTKCYLCGEERFVTVQEYSRPHHCFLCEIKHIDSPKDIHETGELWEELLKIEIELNRIRKMYYEYNTKQNQ